MGHACNSLNPSWSSAHSISTGMPTTSSALTEQPADLRNVRRVEAWLRHERMALPRSSAPSDGRSRRGGPTTDCNVEGFSVSTELEADRVSLRLARSRIQAPRSRSPASLRQRSGSIPRRTRVPSRAAGRAPPSRRPLGPPRGLPSSATRAWTTSPPSRRARRSGNRIRAPGPDSFRTAPRSWTRHDLPQEPRNARR
jgi:hypothetical protein